MADYLASLRLLLDRDEVALFPTHGPPVEQPRAHVEALIEHRLERERQIVEQLERGPRTIDELVAVLYAEVREELHRPAARSVEAHLIALLDAGTARRDGQRWRRS
jgi:glyoxylase-like metal-dependent hydrolase (beta-lactamase superfamily II)